MTRPHLLLVTGKLAEPSLRRELIDLGPRFDFDHTVVVMPISVAALMTTGWVARHLTVPSAVDRIVLPGLCSGDMAPLAEQTGLPVERGPKDLRDLAEYFGGARTAAEGYGAFDIAIVAEINHAPRLSRADLLSQARAAVRAGADVIDVGCDPGSTWTGVGDAVRCLRAEGIRASIDSFNSREVEAAVATGAELVLSVNSTNVDAARSWGCEVVAVPDVPTTLEGLDRTVERLLAAGVPFRIDPILEPIGFGFAASLGRFLEVRKRYPQTEMMMGVGNITELTEVDSAGINVLLLGFCQEVGVRSVLTTEVINWCRTCVRELDLARRLVYHACTRHVLPKHLADDLVMLRDAKIRERGASELRELAGQLRDPNVRLFAERERLHALSGRMHLDGADPFVLFEAMRRHDTFDVEHAFYLGYEMAKAVTALTLGKNYVQDQALRWGFLTVPEESHRDRGKGEGTS
jgi:dihydropteroate synthase-like protein